MSLFGSLMGDFEDDPFFGSHMQSMQRMNNMMNSMFADPFGMMGGPPAIMNSPQNHLGAMGGMQMMPFGFMPMPQMNIGRMFSNMENMNSNPNCHSFTSSSIMTMTTGPDGRPQVYQESMSTKAAPGGVKETKKTVSDSRTGVRKLAIGHHIGERAHIIEREHNVRNGDQEENQEFINLEEDEAETFNREWETRTKRSMSAIGGPSYRSNNPYSRAPENRQLALPSTTPSSSRQSRNHSRPIASPRRSIRPAHSPKSNNITSRPADSTTSSSTNTSSNSNESTTIELPENLCTTNRRKREHTPEPTNTEPSSKRQSTGQDDNKED